MECSKTEHAQSSEQRTMLCSTRASLTKSVSAIRGDAFPLAAVTSVAYRPSALSPRPSALSPQACLSQCHAHRSHSCKWRSSSDRSNGSQLRGAHQAPNDAREAQEMDGIEVSG
jgi:hypothetical protein